MNVILTTLALLGQAVQPPLQAAVDAVNHAFTTPKGQKIEVVGVCQIDTDATACWKTDGTPDIELTRQIENYYEAQVHADLRFVPGAKHRYAVFRRPRDTYAYVTDKKGGFLGTTDQGSTDLFLQWARATVDPETKSFEIFMVVPFAKPLTPAEIPFREGAKLEYQGTSFQLGPIRPQEGGFRNSFGGGFDPAGIGTNPGWKVDWLQKADSPMQMDFAFTPIGKDGKPILYVDTKGNPLSETQYLQALAEASVQVGGGVHAARPAPAAFTPANNFFGNPQRGYSFQTNVAPGRLASIRITASERLRIRFGGLPTDPK
ncbi:hypothetical protein EON79_02300 [bacterium]|nr:MAG: hypothetical protein EON79_02300 [bacterium]